MQDGSSDSADQGLQTAWRIRLRELLKSLPVDYDAAKVEALAISRDFHDELANSLGPKLNAKLAQLPRQTLDECRELASFCNAELAEMHLCIRCPRTGLGTVLLGDFRDAAHTAPRFRLQGRGGRGQVLRTFSSRELPQLELMADGVESRRPPPSNQGRGRGA